jgi:cationic peptide transport system substrate-binding protein
MKILAKEVPLIPIAHSKRYQARSKEVMGKIISPFGGISFYKTAKNTSNKEGITKFDDTIESKEVN